MKDKESIRMTLISFGILCAGYFVIRYALFETHGMLEWPLDLFIGCAVVLVISFLIRAKLLPLVTSVSYIIGFVIGLLFHETVDGVDGRNDNLWIIWTAVVIAAVILSGIAEFLREYSAQ